MLAYTGAPGNFPADGIQRFGVGVQVVHADEQNAGFTRLQRQGTDGQRVQNGFCLAGDVIARKTDARDEAADDQLNRR